MSESRDRILQHVGEYVHGASLLTSEDLGDGVSVDIYAARPTKTHEFVTLFTAGISDRPMQVPPGESQHWAHVELVAALPANWRVDDPSLEWFWPIGWMTIIADRVLLEHEFMCALHTVCFDPPEPLAPNTDLCCILLGFPRLYGPGFSELRLGQGKRLQFLSMHAIYREELQFMLRQGERGRMSKGAILFKFFPEAIDDVIDIHRKNTCKKRFLFF